MAAGGLVAPGVWLLAALAIVYAGGVDYARRGPRLSLPEYLCLYVAEHAAYQTGVLAGRATASAHVAAAGRPAVSIDGAEASVST